MDAEAKKSVFYCFVFFFFFWVEEFRYWENILLYSSDGSWTHDHSFSTSKVVGLQEYNITLSKIFLFQDPKCPWPKMSYFPSDSFHHKYLWVECDLLDQELASCSLSHNLVRNDTHLCHLLPFSRGSNSNITPRPHSLVNSIPEVLKDFDPGCKTAHISLPPQRKITDFVNFFHWQTSFSMKRYKFSTS